MCVVDQVRRRRGGFCRPPTGGGCWDFYHHNLLVYYWTLRHPKDLFGAKTLLRDHVCELALEKGDDDDVGHADGEVLDEPLSSGLWDLPAGPGALPGGPCGGEFGWAWDGS